MKKILVIFIISLLFFNLQVGTVFAADIVERVYGLNRYQTAVQIAFKINPGIVQTIILANGNSFADSLAGVPLAKQKKAPLLYVGNTPADSGDAFSYIQNHLAKGGEIYILGGSGVVPDNFISALVNLGIRLDNIHRLGGSNRYETAVAIAKEINNNGTEFFIASGENFPDALSGSVRAAVLGDITQEEADYQTSIGKPTIAVEGGVPLLLIPSDGTVPDCVIDYLNSVSMPGWLPNWLQKQFFNILGGTGAVPVEAIKKLSENVNRFDSDSGIRYRYNGIDRYQTMETINHEGFEDFYVKRGLGYKVPHVYIATGEDFPDALAGAVLAALNHSPLILVNNDLPTPSIDLLAHFSSENSQGSPVNTTLTVIGDTQSVSESAKDFLQSVFK